ncbi:MAG: hypothetical protein RJA59_1959 [Pseudomonadota bacterium]
MKIAGYEVHPAAQLFPMLDEVALQRLAEDIKANGQKVPIVLLAGQVLDGRNRLLACKKAGIEPFFVEFDTGNPWRAVWSYNRERRQIEDAIRLGLIGKEMIKGSDSWEAKQEKARELTSKAHSEAGKKGGRGNKAPPSREGPAFQAAPRDRSRTEAARLAEEIGGVSRSTMERVIELEKKATPAQVEAVRQGQSEGLQVLREVKREAKHASIAEQSKSAKPIGDVQPCPIVYADPPWQYGNTAGASAAEDEYPTMPLADICALPVPATKDAVLFLWATSPLLPEAMKVIDAWGFTYKGSIVWDKDMGTGNWVLNCHELLLIAVRGDIPCPAPANRPKSVVRAPRGKHSAKPEVFAEMIERMFPGLPKVEMFARRVRAGWSAWGNQAA